VLLLSGGQVGLSYVGANEWGGLLLTLLIFTFTLSIGLPIAVLLAILRALVSPVFRGAIKIISEIIRSLPLAVVLLAFVLIIPYLCGAGASGLRLFSAALGLALYFAFYMSEVLVAGMTSVPTTQWDAARALGLSELLTVRLIVIPQALPISIPAATNELRIAIKETSILAIIGVMELTGSTRAAYEAGPASENFLGLYLVAGVMYATLLYGVILFGKSLEATFNIQRQLPDAAKIPSAIAEQVDRA
jgi:general L-amino acid transport system permease protein